VILAGAVLKHALRGESDADARLDPRACRVVSHVPYGVDYGNHAGFEQRLAPGQLLRAVRAGGRTAGAGCAHVGRDPDWDVQGRTHALATAGATAAVATPPKVSITQVASEQEIYAEKRNRLLIRHSSGDDLVAYIEIVSSGNKTSRRALDRFLDKACTATEQDIHLLVIDPHPPGPLDPNGIHGAIWGEIDPAAPFRFPDDRKLTLASYCAASPPQAYVEPLAVGMALPGMALFLDPQWYVTVSLESSYCAAWEAIPARWRRVLSE